jgi:prepilin-type N-terminal cleavage/methylation domain-containing protein
VTPGRTFRRAKRGRRATAGFTLLESLIAVAVMAALLALLPRTLIDARTMTSQSHHWLQARLAAEAILAEEFASETLFEGVRSGRAYERDWTAQVMRTAAPAPPEPEFGLFHIRLTVAVTPRHELSIETVRIGRLR